METYTVTVSDKKTIAWRNSAGKLHREDGPAIESADGTKFWYVNDKNLTQEQFLARTKPKQASCAGKVVEIDGVKYILVKA